MSPSEEKSSKWIPGRYPPPGTSPAGDAIRQRRGARGITALDAALLHVPPAAEGWNTLLGAVRTKGSLTDDIRELMVCVQRPSQSFTPILILNHGTSLFFPPVDPTSCCN